MKSSHENNQYCKLNNNSHKEQLININDFPIKVISEESSDDITEKKQNSGQKDTKQESELNIKLNSNNKIHIKKNFSQDIFDKIKQKENKFSSAKNMITLSNNTTIINSNEEVEDNKTKLKRISEQILNSNREDMKPYESLITPEIIRPIKCIDLNIHDSSEEEQTQKLNKMKDSFRSCSSHKNFLVKVNMIGNIGAGKTEFVNIITNNKKPKQNIKQAKKAMKCSQKFSKK